MAEEETRHGPFAVIDVGCHECGVGSEVVGYFTDEDAAQEACDERFSETQGWRDGGQTICQVFNLGAPA